jgi:Ala-tRNA(Pro) deacylase
MIKRLKEFLDQNNIKYQVITHSTAFTAQEIAESAHIPGKELAKVVMVSIDGNIAMAVLPASHFVDLKRIKEMTGGRYVELTPENEYIRLFDDCEPGAMAPFGNLYNLKVYVSTSLSEDPYIVFNAGTHRELVRLSYKDFANLVRPEVFSFSVKEQQGKRMPPKEG